MKTLRILVVMIGHEEGGVQTQLLNDFAHRHAAAIHFEYVCLMADCFYEKLRELGAPVKLIDGQVPIKSPNHPLFLPFLWLRMAGGFRRAYKAILAELHQRRSGGTGGGNRRTAHVPDITSPPRGEGVPVCPAAL